eukprot:460408-Rhodomonas_salina.8
MPAFGSWTHDVGVGIGDRGALVASALPPRHWFTRFVDSVPGVCLGLRCVKGLRVCDPGFRDQPVMSGGSQGIWL